MQPLLLLSLPQILFTLVYNPPPPSPSSQLPPPVPILPFQQQISTVTFTIVIIIKIRCNGNGFFVVRIVSKRFAATISAFFFTVTEETEIDAVKIWQKMQIFLSNFKQQLLQRFPPEKNIARTSQYQEILYKQNGRSQNILRV